MDTFLVTLAVDVASEIFGTCSVKITGNAELTFVLGLEEVRTSL